MRTKRFMASLAMGALLISSTAGAALADTLSYYSVPDETSQLQIYYTGSSCPTSGGISDYYYAPTYYPNTFNSNAAVTPNYVSAGYNSIAANNGTTWTWSANQNAWVCTTPTAAGDIVDGVYYSAGNLEVSGLVDSFVYFDEPGGSATQFTGSVSPYYYESSSSTCPTARVIDPLAGRTSQFQGSVSPSYNNSSSSCPTTALSGSGYFGSACPYGSACQTGTGTNCSLGSSCRGGSYCPTGTCPATYYDYQNQYSTPDYNYQYPYYIDTNTTTTATQTGGGILSQAATATPTVLAMEQTSLSLLNSERMANGLQPLRMDSTIETLARLKSQDMAAENYFAHESENYGSAADMLEAAGVGYSGVGENIAHYEDVVTANAALMSSSGHRQNILGSQWTKVGVGVALDDNGYPLITQIFAR